MIQGKTITIVIPCKNEANIIGRCLNRIPSCIDEVLVIDNNSTDTTASVARKHEARVIKEKRTVDGIGYGFAHQTGIQKATSDYIVALDGDDTYPMNTISTIIRTMEKEHIDVISCNRLPLTNPHVISKTRQFGIHILNTLVFVLYGHQVKDILSGMWIGKREALQELHVTSGGWNFSPEIKLSALIHPSIVFDEYHINHFSRAKEPSKQQIWKTGFNHSIFIIKKRVTDLQKQFVWTVQAIQKGPYAKSS